MNIWIDRLILNLDFLQHWPGPTTCDCVACFTWNPPLSLDKTAGSPSACCSTLWHSREQLAEEEDPKVSRGDSVGGDSSGPVGVLLGCVTPLECVQHEHGPPEQLQESRISVCWSHLSSPETVCCVILFVLTATNCAGITSGFLFMCDD